MTQRVLIRRQRAKAVNRPVPPLPLTLRATTPVRPGMRALYPLGVAGDRQVDRAAWARVITNLIATETRGKIAPFARRVEVAERTVSRWLRSEVAVSEESVRDVALAMGRNPMDLLVEVGYYSRTEIAPPAHDDVLALIRDDPKLTADQKVEAINLVLDRRERQRAAEMDEVQRLIKMLTDGDG